MPVALVLVLLVALLGIAIKLVVRKRDRFGTALLVALPVAALVFAVSLTVCLVRDCAAYTDCVDACVRPTDIEIAFPVAFIAGYAFVLLVVVALARGLVLTIRGRRASEPGRADGSG